MFLQKSDEVGVSQLPPFIKINFQNCGRLLPAVLRLHSRQFPQVNLSLQALVLGKIRCTFLKPIFHKWYNPCFVFCDNAFFDPLTNTYRSKIGRSSEPIHSFRYF